VTLGAQGTKVAIQVVSVIVLARLLDPHDYGLIAMVVTLIGIGELLRDFGLSSAAIQAPTLSVAQRNNLFWINTGIGLVLALLVYVFGAPLLSLLYSQPDLVPITHALALIFVVNGLTTQYRADLVRRLRFSRLALADILAPAIALCLAIVAALLGWGYWALVVQQLAQAVVLLLIVSVSARWLPGRPRRHVPLADLIRFGGNLVATQLVGYISNNADSFTIGIRFGATPLGFYSRAFQLLMTPLNQVRIPLTTVALPVLSRLASDTRRVGEYVAQGQIALGYTLVAGLGLVVGAGHPITAIFLGGKWLSVAPILSLLALAGIFQILAFVGYWVYLSRGLTRDLFRYTLLSSAIKVLCIVFGSQWGVIGVAAGYALAPALSWPISLWWLSRRTDLPVRRLYGGAGRILALVAVSAGTAGALVFVLRGASPWLQLSAAIVAMVAVYVLCALIIPAIRRDVATVVRLARLVPARRAGR
jgi:PST family polysaccharide transporter